MSDRTNVLGVGVSAIIMMQALDTIEGWIGARQSNYVCVRDVHGVTLCQRDDKLRQVHNSAGLVTPDGMPLVWLSRANGFRHVERVCGPDLMLALCERSQGRGYRHFLYGSTERVLERLASNLKQRFPGLQIVGTCSPPFRALTKEEDERAIGMINATNPDIVWVGLSTPKQERWMAAHVHRLTAPVLIGVGAAFDFHSGTKKRAPRWMQRSGLEWSFRLLSEPRRLWWRYLKSNSLFIFLLLQHALGLRRYEDDW